uniref:tRNA/rRNA methyltransferase SpoU type domain-containing protein n=1 Tax=Ornithorhynchus anatinus TaxID=9258 RepID=F6T458_ORNAN
SGKVGGGGERGGEGSCPLTPVVSKASAGALEVLQVYGADDLPALLKAKAAQGWTVAGTVDCSEPRTPVLGCLDFRWDRPTVLVIGNEGSGLSAEVKDACQVLLNVSPGREITSGIESLNVSVAAGNASSPPSSLRVRLSSRSPSLSFPPRLASDVGALVLPHPRRWCSPSVSVQSALTIQETAS